MVDAAHKQWWQIFEVVFGLPMVIAAVLQLWLPLSIQFGHLRFVATAVGAAMIMVGIGFVARARGTFAQHGQPTDPGRPTSQLVTTGVYAVSRNPLYLGGVMLLAGIGFAFNLVWVLLALVPGVVACYRVLILPEERYLAARFPHDYPAYTKSVCRWFGRVGHRDKNGNAGD